MKTIFFALATILAGNPAGAFEVPQMGSTLEEAAVKGAIHAYAKQIQVKDSETGCQGSVSKAKQINPNEGTAFVYLSNCDGLFDGESLAYSVSFRLNLSVPNGVYIVEKVTPSSAPMQTLR